VRPDQARAEEGWGAEGEAACDAAAEASWAGRVAALGAGADADDAAALGAGADADHAAALGAGAGAEIPLDARAGDAAAADELEDVRAADDGPEGSRVWGVDCDDGPPDDPNGNDASKVIGPRPVGSAELCVRALELCGRVALEAAGARVEAAGARVEAGPAFARGGGGGGSGADSVGSSPPSTMC
jgi:hypothetical protein